VQKLACIFFDDPHMMSFSIELCDAVKELHHRAGTPLLPFIKSLKSADVNTNVYVSIKSTTCCNTTSSIRVRIPLGACR
jgi:hypothetical protein